MTAKVHLINSISLIIIGLLGYFSSGSFTALIPVIFGIVLLILYSGVKKECKKASHIAVILTLIVLIALIIQPLNKAISSGEIMSIIRISVMVVTSLLAIIFFIKSFKKARLNKTNGDVK